MKGGEIPALHLADHLADVADVGMALRDHASLAASTEDAVWTREIEG